MFMPDTMPETIFNFTDKVECRKFIEIIEAFEGELFQWEELPGSIVKLVQAQKGLRIDRGLPGCRGEHVLFHPLRGAQKCVRALTGNLKNVPKPCTLGKAPWDKLFLRHGIEELGDLPKVVEFKCPFEGCKATNKNHAPRWTIQPNPTLVTRQFKCPECGRKGDWIPISPNFDHIRSESLSRTWGCFVKKGCDLTRYPRRADVYFSQGHIDIQIAQLKEATMLGDQRS